jgi:hypothetical protein
VIETSELIGKDPTWTNRRARCFSFLHYLYGVDNMEKSGITILGILSILMVVVTVSGCTSSDTSNNTQTGISNSKKKKSKFEKELDKFFKRTPNALGHLYHPDKEEEEEFEGSHL